MAGNLSLLICGMYILYLHFLIYHWNIEHIYYLIDTDLIQGLKLLT